MFSSLKYNHFVFFFIILIAIHYLKMMGENLKSNNNFYRALFENTLYSLVKCAFSTEVFLRTFVQTFFLQNGFRLLKFSIILFFLIIHLISTEVLSNWNIVTLYTFHWNIITRCFLSFFNLTHFFNLFFVGCVYLDYNATTPIFPEVSAGK